MSDAERINLLVKKLSRLVDGTKRSSPFTSDASSVPSIMAIAEKHDDITPDAWKQIADLTRRIEALEKKRKQKRATVAPTTTV